MRTHHSWFHAAGLCLFVCAPPLAHAQPKKEPPKKEAPKEDPMMQEARRLFDEAEVHYKLQEFETALSKYKESYRLTLAPALLFNIGQCYRQMERYEEALKAYQSFLREQPDTPNRARVEELIQETETAQAAAVAAATAASQPATGPGGTTTVVIKESANSKLPALVLYGAAGLAGATGLAFSAGAFLAARDSREFQEQSFTNSEDVVAASTRGRRLAAAADVAFVVAAGAGISGFILGKRAKQEKAALLLSPGGLAVSARF